MRIEPYLAIAGMALVTYATRSGGMWLMGFVNPTPRVQAWLREVPGAVLIAIIAPLVLASGLAGLLAVMVTVAVARRTENLLLPMLAGVLTVWILRHVM